MKPQILGTLRTFKTAQFTVIVDALEDYDPDLSWDDTGEVRAGLESGKFTCFTVRARVIHKTLGEVAADYLGGCIHETLEAFMDHKECAAQNRENGAGRAGSCGSYFADMIANVCADARKAIKAAQGIKVRA